jgi:hypothetical protein
LRTYTLRDARSGWKRLSFWKKLVTPDIVARNTF